MVNMIHVEMKANFCKSSASSTGDEPPVEIRERDNHFRVDAVMAFLNSGGARLRYFKRVSWDPQIFWRWLKGFAETQGPPVIRLSSVGPRSVFWAPTFPARPV